MIAINLFAKAWNDGRLIATPIVERHLHYQDRKTILQQVIGRSPDARFEIAGVAVMSNDDTPGPGRVFGMKQVRDGMKVVARNVDVQAIDPRDIEWTDPNRLIRHRHIKSYLGLCAGKP